jgi:hypothetical protein
MTTAYRVGYACGIILRLAIIAGLLVAAHHIAA